VESNSANCQALKPTSDHGNIKEEMPRSMHIYTASQYRTVPLMCSVHRVLLKQMRLQQATEDGNAEIWITKVVAECVPDCRANHGERTTTVHVELYSWHDE